MLGRIGSVLTKGRGAAVNHLRTMAPKLRMEFERRRLEMEIDVAILKEVLIASAVQAISQGKEMKDAAVDMKDAALIVAQTEYIDPMQAIMTQLLQDSISSASQTVYPEFYEVDSEVAKEYYSSFMPEFDRIEGSENGEKSEYAEKAQKFLAEKAKDYLKLIRWIAAVTFCYEFYQGWQQYEEDKGSEAVQGKDEYKIGDEEFFAKFPEALDRQFKEFVAKIQEEFARIVGNLPYNGVKSDLKEDMVNQEFAKVVDSILSNILDGVDKKIESKVNDQGAELTAKELEQLQLVRSFTRGCAVAVRSVTRSMICLVLFITL